MLTVIQGSGNNVMLNLPFWGKSNFQTVLRWRYISFSLSFPLFVFVLTPRLKRCWKCPDTAQTLEATPHPLLESGFFAFRAFAVDSETFSWAAIVPLMHTWLSCLICLKYPAAPLITSLFFPVFWQLFYLFSYFFVPRFSTNRNIKES